MSRQKDYEARQPSRTEPVQPRTIVIYMACSLVLAFIAYFSFAVSVIPAGADVTLRVLAFLLYATLSAVLAMSVITLYTLRVTRRQQKRVESSVLIAGRLALAIELRDPCAPGHNGRIGSYCRIVGEEMGLSQDFCELMQFAAPLHDVGKMGVPDRILHKPGPLTADERDLMQQHVPLGASILAECDDPLMQLAHTIVLTHHEAWDGTGYPNGLAGEEIPMEGRIAGVCDVFDALMSPRAYKDPWPVDQVMAEILRLKGTRFDPRVVEAVERCLPRMIEVDRQHGRYELRSARGESLGVPVEA